MVTRWEVTKAVRNSDLPAASRLIMLTLADSAETGTAEIPPRFTPSVAVLARETGLDRRTVQRHLAALEAAGWVIRTRPDERAQWFGERIRYRLALPSGMEPPQVADNHKGGGTEPHGWRQDATGVAAESPKGGGTEPPLYTDHSDQSQIKSDPSSSSAKPTKAEVATPERPDVELVCRHLADRIEANGSKRPTITKAWRDAARRLIDRDGRTVEQIMRAIDWCQDDEFWRANILSMPKLREKYDQLRLAAARSNMRVVRRSTTDQRVADALELARRFEEAS